MKLGQFPFFGKVTDSYRSLLYFEQVERKGIVPASTFCWTGPAGIEHYLAADNRGRLIQSLKSFLAVRNMEGTQVFERKRTIEELIGRILGDVRTEASRQFGVDVRHATVGRPVKFVGADNIDDDHYAEDRLADAFSLAGFDSIAFELEPIAAAHEYEVAARPRRAHPDRRLRWRHQRLFTRQGRSQASSRPGARTRTCCATPVSASRAMHSMRRSSATSCRRRSGRRAGTDRPTSACHCRSGWSPSNLERWHHLSFLKSREVIEQLERIKAQAMEPDMIESLIYLVKFDLGYQLHQAVQKLKTELSVQEHSEFEFRDGALTLKSVVDRATFESWIEDELLQISTCIDGLLASSGVAPANVDAVFLTGGSSFVPAVRQISNRASARRKSAVVTSSRRSRWASRGAQRPAEHRATGTAPVAPRPTHRSASSRSASDSIPALSRQRSFLSICARTRAPCGAANGHPTAPTDWRRATDVAPAPSNGVRSELRRGSSLPRTGRRPGRARANIQTGGGQSRNRRTMRAMTWLAAVGRRRSDCGIRGAHRYQAEGHAARRAPT